MLQATMVEPGRIQFDEVPRPEAGVDEVVIEVKACGICGSDVHVWKGEHPFTSYPIIQGHEFSGVVDSVGTNVDSINPGAKVTIEPSLVCGTCHPCRHGRYNICDNLKVMGFQADGCHRNFFAVPQQKVVPLPPEISFEPGAMVEPAAVGVHAVKRSGLKAGGRVLVLGAGPIGILTMQAAKGMGASEVMITDVVNFRLETARRVGADYTVNVAEEDLFDSIKGAFGRDGLDVVIECVGSEQALETAIQVARKGSRIVVVGVVGGRPRLSLGLLQDRELEMIGSLMYMREDFELAIDLIRTGRINPVQLITRRFEFEHLPEAYREADERKGQNLKVMVIF